MEQVAKRIGAGEYEYKGYFIHKDEYDGTWWVTQDSIFEDFYRLKDAKKWIDKQARDTQGGVSLGVSA